MSCERVLTGEVTQFEEPFWEPLEELVGDQVVGDFMWMHEVELSDGTRLHAYKHIDTRRYFHLSAGGDTFTFESPNGYRRIDVVDAATEVFEILSELAGGTEERVAASDRVLTRLRAR